MNISAPFIRRPVATTLLTIGLALSGLLAMRLLPVAALPQVDSPTISVAAALPGASPQTMATSVAAPLERQFGSIAGITEMTSASNLGATSITMQFDLKREINGAARDVQAAINAARGYLPEDLPSNPTYRKVNPADAPILILALTSESATTAQMYDAASSILQQRLSQVEGVGQVLVGGGSNPAVRVELNPAALARYGIGIDEVRSAIAGANSNLPKGQLENDEKSWEIRTNDQIRTAEGYKPLLIALKSRTPVRLSDIADVKDSVEDLRTVGLVNGKAAVPVILFRQPGANIIATVDRVLALIPELASSLPGKVDISVVLDRTTPIRASLLEVKRALLISGILVILVVFVFLRNVRAALIPSITVPVSLISTFGVMYLLDYSLDNLSLMALTIATGFVVDDAIVVLENVTRQRELGLGPLEAALAGAKEIGFTVVAISISLVAVFIPLLLMGGILGRLFREFAVTLSVAVLVSMVISLTTTPMMCAILLKPAKAEGGDRTGKEGKGGFTGLHKTYEKSLTWSLGHPRLMLASTVATLAVGIALFRIAPKGFFPQQDNGRLTGLVQGSQDISFQAMKQKLAAVNAVILRDSAVTSSITIGGGGNTTVNTGRMFVVLKPPAERKIGADAVIARLRKELARVPGIQVFLQSIQDLRVGGLSSGGQYQFTLQSESLDDLNTWAPQVEQRLRGLKEISDVNSDQQDKGLQTFLTLDRASASRFGVTPQLIDQTLSDAFSQRQVSVIYSELNQYHVVLEAAPRWWQRPDGLRSTYVAAPSGAQVPMASFSCFQPKASLLAVNHKNQFPSATISFNLSPGMSLGPASSAIESATRSMGLPAGIRTGFSGTAQAFKSSLASQPLLILAALVAVYLVLGMLYESLVHPLTILSTLPSAGMGAILALLLTGTEISIIGIIGMILLIGIVKKNGIMMVDFALDAQRNRNMPPRDAIFHACMLRFRPIMMTTSAALLAALPLALGRGVGFELRRPLGIAIIGGLIVSQLLTLYTTPVIYLYLEKLKARFSRGHARGNASLAALMAVLFASTALLAGCSGPEYKKPQVTVPPAYKETRGWKAAQPRDHELRGAWWELFGDTLVDALERQAADSNQSLAVSEAQYRQALAAVVAARAGYFPTVSVQASGAHSRASATQGSNASTSAATTATGVTTGANKETTSDFFLSAGASWEPDLWGKVRRQVEASEAGAKASAADLESARLSIQTTLAQTYFQLRIQDEQARILDSVATANQRFLALTESRYKAGVASQADVLQAQTQLKTTQAQAVDAGVQRSAFEHAIAVLIGKPASLFSVPVAPLAQTVPPIPEAVPSKLLERRPDVAAAERRVAAANAQIGVAMAGYFPDLTLTATTGFASRSLTGWFAAPSLIWSLGASAAGTLFEGGLRKAASEQTRAAYEGTVAAYRQTVLTAFQEVEDNLAALRILEEEARLQDEAVAAARQSLDITLERYNQGVASALDVITAQTALLDNRRAAAAVLGGRLSASLLLVKALGGGWDPSRLGKEMEKQKAPAESGGR
jgi:multidrug efflux pump